MSLKFTINASFNIVGSAIMKDVSLHNYLDMKKPLHFKSEDEAMNAISNIDTVIKL